MKPPCSCSFLHFGLSDIQLFSLHKLGSTLPQRAYTCIFPRALLTHIHIRLLHRACRIGCLLSWPSLSRRSRPISTCGLSFEGIPQACVSSAKLQHDGAVSASRPYVDHCWSRIRERLGQAVCLPHTQGCTNGHLYPVSVEAEPGEHQTRRCRGCIRRMFGI